MTLLYFKPWGKAIITGWVPRETDPKAQICGREIHEGVLSVLGPMRSLEGGTGPGKELVLAVWQRPWQILLGALELPWSKGAALPHPTQDGVSLRKRPWPWVKSLSSLSWDPQLRTFPRSSFPSSGVPWSWRRGPGWGGAPTSTTDTTSLFYFWETL